MNSLIPRKDRKEKTTQRSQRGCGPCVVYFLVAYSYYQKYNSDIYITNMLILSDKKCKFLCYLISAFQADFFETTDTHGYTQIHTDTHGILHGFYFANLCVSSFTCGLNKLMYMGQNFFATSLIPRKDRKALLNIYCTTIYKK